MFGDIRGICSLAAEIVWSLPFLTTWRRYCDFEVYCVSFCMPLILSIYPMLQASDSSDSRAEICPRSFIIVV
jgi:hypothetical protein